jgi:hypothetical protein
MQDLEHWAEIQIDKGNIYFFLEQSVIFVYHILTFIEAGIPSVGVVASSSSSTTRERHRR